MVSQAHEALTRLKAELRSETAAEWLDDARVERGASGYVLTVASAFRKHWFETRCAQRLQDLFGAPVEIRSEPGAAPIQRVSRVMPRLSGSAGEYAIRMVRAFMEGGPASASLVVVHGPRHCGKSLLVDWAVGQSARRAFRIDLARVRAGRSRGLVPRKPLVVADGVERLAGRAAAQRTLCTILDVVRDRGDRALVTIEGHPSEVEGIFPALRNRLKGGVLVRLEQPTTGDMRCQLRERSKRHGMRLPVDWEDELSKLPPAAALRALDMRMLPGAEEHEDALERMKDVAAQLLGVDVGLAGRRRIVVEARRAVMAAACGHGFDEMAIAESFGLKSVRTVREACRWAEREQRRDRRFAALLHEVARVLPRG